MKTRIEAGSFAAAAHPRSRVVRATREFPNFVIFIGGEKGQAAGMSVPVPTPMMAQYQAMRKSLPADVLLMFRLGDFFEMFFEDAKTASPILNVALTRRNGVPMCGVIARKLLFG